MVIIWVWGLYGLSLQRSRVEFRDLEGFKMGLGSKCSEVLGKHNKHQFVKKIRLKDGRTVLTGTQCMDRWGPCLQL